MPNVELSEVRDALIAAGITGSHQSHSRSSSISKIHSFVEGDPDVSFGLSGLDGYSASEILGFMADLTGCPPDIDCSDEDFIDPQKTIDGIVAAAGRLADRARTGATLLLATGHPTGMLEHQIRVGDAYVRAGGKLLMLREGDELPIGTKGRVREIRYVGGVGCLADWGNLLHTHSPAAMEALLEARPWPDAVMADHGFAGAAVERGIPTIAIMDINDHALAIAHAQGRDLSIVPMDDNRPPGLYEPSWRLFEDIIVRA